MGTALIEFASNLGNGWFGAGDRSQFGHIPSIGMLECFPVCGHSRELLTVPVAHDLLEVVNPNISGTHLRAFSPKICVALFGIAAIAQSLTFYLQPVLVRVVTGALVVVIGCIAVLTRSHL